MTTERASWGTRALAQLIDGLIITAITLVILMIVAGAGGSDDAIGIALYAGAAITSMLYATLLLSRTGESNGQTIGKHAMGIRVLRADSAPITPGLAARREIIGRGLLGLIPLYTIIDIFWPLSDAGKQALHDKVADTFVVPADAAAASAPGSITTYVASVPTPPLPVPESAPAHAPAPPPQAPQPAPDLGDFAPPVEHPEVAEPFAEPVAPERPPARRKDEIPGPFGPSYDE
jgi:uncharacterized RDD family membrane protein YckC